MGNEDLGARLSGIERRLDAQLVWQAAVTPVLLAMLEKLDDRGLQMRIVSLIEQADALALWSDLPGPDRERARDFAEFLRDWPQKQTAQAQEETGRPGSQT